MNGDSFATARAHRDPFNLVQNNSAEKKARGLKSEILNGRAAMVGLMGLLSASSVPGSVPFLAASRASHWATPVPFSNHSRSSRARRDGLFAGASRTHGDCVF